MHLKVSDEYNKSFTSLILRFSIRFYFTIIDLLKFIPLNLFLFPCLLNDESFLLLNLVSKCIIDYFISILLAFITYIELTVSTNSVLFVSNFEAERAVSNPRPCSSFLLRPGLSYMNVDTDFNLALLEMPFAPLRFNLYRYIFII